MLWCVSMGVRACCCVYEIVYWPPPLRRPSQPLYWRLGLRYRVRRGLHVRKGTEGFLIYLLVLVESVMCWTSICLRNRHGFLGFMGFDMPFFGISMLG